MVSKLLFLQRGEDRRQMVGAYVKEVRMSGCAWPTIK